MSIIEFFTRKFQWPWRATPTRIKQLGSHTYYLPHSHHTDRPILAAVIGTQSTLIVDAGNSPAHAELFLSRIKPYLVSPPHRVVLTHSHWDHIFGLATMNIPGIAYRSVIREIEQMARLDWRNTALEQRVNQGTEILFCCEKIKKEMSETQRAKLILKPPEEVFDESISLNLGGVTCRVEHVGGEHCQDSCVVFIPEDKILFLGDCLYMDIYNGPWSYSPPKLLGLIDKISSFDAEIYVLSHSPPMDHAAMQVYLDDLRTVARATQEAGSRPQEIFRLLQNRHNKPVPPTQTELIQYFVNGLQKETKNE